MPVTHGACRGRGSVNENGQYGLKKPDDIVRRPVMITVNTHGLGVIPHFSVLHSFAL